MLALESWLSARIFFGGKEALPTVMQIPDGSYSLYQFERSAVISVLKTIEYSSLSVY